MRDRLFSALDMQRHHTVLDLNARSGLLTWEAVRQVPEGGVYSRTDTPQDLAALTEQANLLPELVRPVVFQTELATLSVRLSQVADGVKFDRIVGRNVFSQLAPTQGLMEAIVAVLHPTGALALAETVPRDSQRLWQLIPDEKLPPPLHERWRHAEEQLYIHDADPRFAWTTETLVQQLETAGVSVTWTQDTVQSDLFISQKLCDRWFDLDHPKSYAARLAATLAPEELKAIESALRRQVQNQTVSWQSTQLLLTGKWAH